MECKKTLVFDWEKEKSMKRVIVIAALTFASAVAMADATFAKGALPAKIYIDGYKQYTAELERAIRLQAKNPRCAVVQYGDVSSSKSRPGAPVFFVNCDGHDGSTFNTWYSLSDLKKGKAKAARNLSAEAVRSACFTAIKEKLNQPSSFSPHMLDYAVRDMPNGRSQARIGFTASNAFGTEGDYVGRCLVGPDMPAEVTISEK